MNTEKDAMKNLGNDKIVRVLDSITNVEEQLEYFQFIHKIQNTMLTDLLINQVITDVLQQIREYFDADLVVTSSLNSSSAPELYFAKSKNVNIDDSEILNNFSTEICNNTNKSESEYIELSVNELPIEADLNSYLISNCFKSYYQVRNTEYPNQQFNLFLVFSNDNTSSTKVINIIEPISEYIWFYTHNYLDKIKIARQVERLSIIRDIEHLIITEHSTMSIASIAVQNVQKFIACDQAVILLFKFESNVAEIVADCSIIPINKAIGDTLSLDVYHIADKILEKQILIKSDLSLVTNRTIIEDNLYTMGIRSYLSVPLVAYGQLLGVLNLSSVEVGYFTDESIDAARDIAVSVAIALYQSKVREEIISNNENLELIVNERTKQLVEANNKLQENESLIMQIANNVPGAVFKYSIYHDLSYKISFISKGCKDIFSLESPDMVGQGLEILNLFAEDRDSFFDSLLKSRETLNQWNWQFRINSINNDVKWIRVLAQPIKNIIGDVTWTGTFTDITDIIMSQEEVMRLNTELKDNIHKLEAANKELEAFSYSISHDLRSPLRSMNGFSEVLMDEYYDSLDDTARDYLKRIQSASSRMAILIDDLLKLSKLTRTEIQSKSVNLIAVAQSIISEIRNQYPEQNIITDLIDEFYVNVDPALLRILLTNIIENARKFSSKKSETIISIGVKEIDGEKYVYIMDNGAGFDMAYKHKVFGAFQRLHTEQEFEGTGIGLAIVQRIINKHGGKIFIESEINQGTTVYLNFR